VRLSIFLPTLLTVRPVHASAKLLPSTGTACEARLAGKMLTATGRTLPSACTWSTRAFGFLAPVPSTPLKMAFPRPSQKFRNVKTALIMVGVLRGCTRRTFTPPTLKIGSGVTVQFSSALPGMMSLKLRSVTLCEETTSSASKSTAESRSSGFASRCSGKFAGVNVAFGPATWNVVAAWIVPGFTWFFSRLSAPPWKWQLPHDWMPSLLSCMSQKSALPSATAAASSRTKSGRFAGFGTGTVFSDAGGSVVGAGGGTCAPVLPPLSTTGASDARSSAKLLFSVRIVIVAPHGAAAVLRCFRASRAGFTGRR